MDSFVIQILYQQEQKPPVFLNQQSSKYYAMSESVEQKIDVPGCSSTCTTSSRYPSKQKKLGPAPFASFEDLNDDAYPSIPGDPSKTQRMPEIQEDETAKSPEIDSNLLESGRCSIGGTNAPFSPPSGPTSGLQTPSTPRIDISCASSGTPQSESSSEKELFQCTLGLAFHEDGTEDLRSSTEELDLGPEDFEKSKKDKDKDIEESIRRTSHPANLLHQGKISVSPDLDEQVRKLSTHSVCLDGFHQRSTRHHSFGASDCTRPGAHSSLSAHSNISGRRSSSPHKMLYETSFCGNKPIPTPSMDLGDSPTPPKEQTQTTIVPENESNPNRLKQDSDSSLSQTMEMLTETTIQVHHFTHTKISRGGSPAESAVLSSTSPPPPSPKPSQTSISTKSAPREIVSNHPPETNAQCSSADANRNKAIKSNKSSSSVESESGKRVAHPQKSTSAVDLNYEEVLRNEEMVDRVEIDGDAPIETKGLFLQESQDQDDDDDLPYVPTTLPMEKSAVVSMVPVKQRRFDFSMTTNPIQRPRCINPPNLASINDYIVHTTVNQDVNCEDKKMKINLPREDSASEIPVNKPKSPKKKGPTSWTDFAEMGLRSPREIRRKMKEENGATRDLYSYQSDPSDGCMSANNWSDGDTESLQTA